MKNSGSNIIIFLFILIVSLSCSREQEFTLNSPSGMVEMEFILTKDTSSSSSGLNIFYELNFNGHEVLEDSPLGLVFADEASLTGLEVIGTDIKNIDETWERVWGKSKKVRNYCNEMEIRLAEASGEKREVNIIFRAYDDGLAFRYEIPEQEAIHDFKVGSELTAFCFTGDYKVWATEHNSFVSSQEDEFNEITISDIKPDGFYGTPLLVEAGEEVWAALLEANLTDWAGMCLTGSEEPNSVQVRLSPLPGQEEVAVISKAPGYSPWRVIMLADEPGKLIESNLIYNLNAPCVLEDVSWIQPGKCAWDWWWNDGYAPDMKRKLGPDLASHKYFIDFAAEMGWPYQLVDWYWYGPPFTSMETFVPNPESDITKYTDICNIPEIVKYAHSKGVKTIIWLEWHHVDKQMDEAFPLYEKWGVSGVKVDFMNRNDQKMVNFYHRVVKKAAEHHLLVDFHGAYMPTGFERTYPNFITREGVLGNEYNKWSDRITPDHCLTLPFTRMLGGHMDFTPGGWIQGNKQTFKVAEKEGLPYTMVMGTRCFQLAMFVVYESALQVICDSPYNYRNSPDGLDFLKIVPTTWDETRAINGDPGDYITIARRSGEDWYVGSMTDWDRRELKIPLSFLGQGKYTAEIWMDAGDADQYPGKLVKSEIEVTNENVQFVKLASAGGMVMHITPVR